MSLTKNINTIRESRLPFYIKLGFWEEGFHLCLDPSICCEANKLFLLDVNLDSPKQTPVGASPFLTRIGSNTLLNSPENPSMKKLDKKAILSQAKKLVKKYFASDQMMDDPKIRYHSLEKVTPPELSSFWKHSQTLKDVKQKCDCNLWNILEMAKEFYKLSRNYPIQSLLHDLGLEIFIFLFSSIGKLRFDQCKSILEKIEELENIAIARQSDQPQKTPQMGPRLSRQSSLQQAPETESIFPLSKLGKGQGGKKVPNLSLKSLIPGIFGSMSELKVPDPAILSRSNSRKKSIIINEKVLYKKLTKIISKTKYIIAQVGYLLHYEQLSNPVAELLTKKNNKKVESQFSINSLGQKANISNISTALHLNSTLSLDDDGGVHSTRTDTSIFELTCYSNRFVNYIFENQSCLDDSNESILEKRQEKLQKYCIGKAKKWFFRKKKEELEKKYERYEIVCKICEQKIQIEKMKDHSFFCRLKFEANKEMKDTDDKIGETIFECFMKGKELETSLRIDHKNYSKLKNQKEERSRANTPTMPSFPISQDRREGSQKQSFSNSPNLRLEPKLDWFPKKPQNVILKRRKEQGFFKSQSGKVGELKSYIDEIRNEAPGSENLGEREPDDFEIEDEKEQKKTCVGRFLQKQHIKMQESGCFSGDEATLSENSLQKAKSIELGVASPVKGEVQYFSEPPKSDSDSGERTDSVDSKMTTDSSKPTRANSNRSDMPVTINKIEIPHPSDSAPPDLGLSLTDSTKSSPSNNRIKTASYKKSNFYHETAFPFDKSQIQDEEKEEFDVEEQKISHKKEGADEPSSPTTKIFAPKPVTASTLTNDQETMIFKSNKRPTLKAHNTVVLGDPTREGRTMTRHIDTKQTEELIKLRQQINKKKEMIKVFEMITTKGKIIMNKEPYQWKMEKLKDDLSYELSLLLNRLEDDTIKAYVEKFLSLMEKRIERGKAFVDAKKKVELLQTSNLDKLSPNISEKLSLLRESGGLVIPPRKTKLDRSPIGKRNPNKKSTVTLRNLKGLIEEDLPVFPPPENKIQDLYPSRNEATFGCESLENEDEDNSQKADFDELGKAFENNKDLLRKTQAQLNLGNPFEPLELTEPPITIDRKMSQSVPAPDLHVPITRSSQSSVDKIDEEDEELEPIEPQQPAEEQKNDEKVQSEESSSPEVPPPKRSVVRELTIMNIGSPLKDNPEKQIEETQQEPRTLANLQQKFFNMTTEASNQPGEPNSPETPSFEIKNPPPLIWRTSTAPTRTQREIRIASKGKANEIKSIVENLKISSSGNIEIKKDEKENQGAEVAQPENTEQMNDDEILENANEEFIRSQSKTKSLLMAPRAVNVRDKEKMMSFRKKLGFLDQRPPTPTPIQILMKRRDQSSSSPEERIPEKSKSPVPMLTASNANRKFFAEDMIEPPENDDDADSPIFLDSPLLTKGYHSDTQVKTIRVSLKKNQVGMSDFEPIKLISKGAFSRVWLVRRKATNDLYAMKVVNLAEQTAKNPQNLQNLREETRILGIAQEDYIVRAVFTFTHETCICFVMEYMLGGDFGDILYNYNALDEDVARFYIAEIVLALEYLHSLGIVHRDLKPDNILLDRAGHAKLTDFGLSESGLSEKMKKSRLTEPESPLPVQRKIKALNRLALNKDELDSKFDLKLKGKPMEKRNEEQTKKIDRNKQEEEKEHERRNSQQKGSNESAGKKFYKKEHRLIGTPDYMAPEIITGESIKNFSIDWWSLGVMLFEFLCGLPPFNDDSPEKIYENIKNLRIPWDQITIGYGEDCMSPEAADLIRKLLVLDHTKRLGANNVNEIKEHPFFKGIDWETLRKQQAPIAIEQKNEIETGNFIRLSGKFSEKEKESPFNIPSADPKAIKNIQAAKEFLNSTSEKFSMYNLKALESGNIKMVEEALREKEKELGQFRDDDHQVRNSPKIYDDIFFTPKE